MLPELSECLGLPRIVNAQIRTNVIKKLKNQGKFEDRTVISLTGHTKIDTLRHYDDAPDNSKKLEMARAIFAPKKKSRLVPSSTITSGQFAQENPQETVKVEVHNEENLIDLETPVER